MANTQTKYLDKYIIPYFEEKNKCWEKLDKPLEIEIYEDYCILANDNEPTYDNREVIFIGHFKNHWGHFLTDEMSKIYYLLKDNSNMPIVYTSEIDLKEQYLDFFKLLEIDISRLARIIQPTKFKRVYIPKDCYKLQEYYSSEYIDIFEKIKNKVDEDENYPKKIFLSRKNFPKAKQRDFGEIREIENFFKDNRYKIIYPEELSLIEQIKTLKSADEVVVTSGTIAHNVLFCKENTKVIILNRSYVFNARQATLNKIAKVNVINIDAQLSFSFQHVGFGPFYYHFSEQLIQYAIDNNLKFQIPKNNDYLKNYLNACKKLLKKMIKEKNKALMVNKTKPFFKNHLKKARGSKKDKFLINMFNTFRFLYFLIYFSK